MKRKINDYESNMDIDNMYNEEDLMNQHKRTKYKALEDVGDLKLSINNIEAKELKRRRNDDEGDMERQVRRKIGVYDTPDFTSVVEPSISKPQSLDIIIHPDAKKQELLNSYKDVLQNMVFNNLAKQNTLRSIPVIPYREYREFRDIDEDNEQNGWNNSESPFPPSTWPLIPGSPPNARILCPRCQKEKYYCKCPKEDINISFPDDLEVD